MPKKSNEFVPKLKYYHIILISILLCPLLIINSNSINKKRGKEKLIKENETFMRKLYLRNLDFSSDTDEICKKGSEDLQNYYVTGNGTEIGIKEDPITSENNPEYINALINLVSGEGDSMENLMDYIMHIIPVLIFLAIAILFLPGWLVCCICCCADCCCCCCCKKTYCKLPFYIISCAFYALSICICIYGLSQSNSVFVGLADTECSLLKFIGEVLDGESREVKPKWEGINGIVGLFDKTKEKINDLTTTTTSQLESKKRNSLETKTKFEDSLHLYSDNIYASGTYKKELTLSDSTKSGDYALQIVNEFGLFTNTNPPTTTPNSFVERWYNEYKEVAKNSETEMETAYENFNDLVRIKDVAIKGLDQGTSSINDIKSSFDEVKDQISGVLIDFSDLIDYYGKLAFKIIFSVLMVIDAAIAAFITLLFFFSLPKCQNSCIKCLLKSLIHIFWNILALLTFFTLLFGFLFTFLGTVGKDLISVVEFLVSDKNLEKGEDAALLGSASKYLTKCINGDGDLKEVLDLNLESMDKIDYLKAASNTINGIANQTNNLLDTKIMYKEYKGRFDKIIQYKTDDIDIFLQKYHSNELTLEFKEYLSILNQKVGDDEWKVTPCPSNNKHLCDESPNPSHTSPFCFEIQDCSNQKVSTWYTSPTTNEDSVKVIDAFIESIKTAKENSGTIDMNNPPNTNSIKRALEILDNRYTAFLRSQTDSLSVFNKTINDLTGIFNEFTGDNNIYSILNCQFIGRNVKVILKYLDKALGTNFYTIGVCLLIAGISMCISISLTILLNIIINININIPGQNNNDIVNVQYMGDPNLGGDVFHGVETEKVRYDDNINVENINEEDLNNGVKVINYN